MVVGKTHDSVSGNTDPQIPDRLQQAKEELGDRLTVGNIPKYNTENQAKRFKL
jgi:hypothetical protein